MKNIIKKLLALRIAPTYKVTYAPEKSRKPELPIQVYNIVGNPKNLAWRSHAGHKLFTTYTANKEKRFIAFRADRVLSINFSGFTLVTKTA